MRAVDSANGPCVSRGNGAPEFRFPHPVPPSHVVTQATREEEGDCVALQLMDVLERRPPDRRRGSTLTQVPTFVDRQERAPLEVLPVRFEGTGDDADGILGDQVLGAELHTLGVR